MKLNNLSDKELLIKTRSLVKRERELLTQILHHLKEVHRRKLYSDLGYKSLFDYAVKELSYSEGQAGRRIQAMKLMAELPSVEEKIAEGKLSLSNICQAQSYFRTCCHSGQNPKQKQQGNNPDSTASSNTVKKEQPLSSQQKLEVLKSLENKSAREGQKILIQKEPYLALPKEKIRPLTKTHTEIRFVMNKALEQKLEELRSLAGPRGAIMNMAELIEFMTEISVESLKIRKFGKKRVHQLHLDKHKNHSDTKKSCVKSVKKNKNANAQKSTIRMPVKPASHLKNTGHKVTNPRSIHPALKHHIWMRDHGKCTKCGSQKNLNYDHIQPIALGGKSTEGNLRLLCFSCNQRQAIKMMGIEKVKPAYQ